MTASGDITIRPLAKEDARQIAGLLNNKNIWNNLRDYIPSPYSKKDALEFINGISEQDPRVTFAITYKNETCGVIGLIQQTDIYRLSAEIGYWVGEPYWGKGIATSALKLATDYGFEKLSLERIFAGTFSHNAASRRVLEKCGYKKEGVARSAVLKNNQILDEHKYAILKSDWIN
ncbi:Protein N-acetyltransferase, RimJ/RimL family [Ekhidna lutea]|uniref:Protein N-acetyltransferase, RimJ/RimL family n=1 Tax=Ekhidna lutea TaxID=447679 RepID=A0A239EVR7_EKHLU|nr:GNAT family protein [Ekhidna lutea]SNS47924.1 Protein N-acetyltransferase, RimJ/RimL family [Ekhidna lutea]